MVFYARATRHAKQRILFRRQELYEVLRVEQVVFDVARLGKGCVLTHPRRAGEKDARSGRASQATLLQETGQGGEPTPTHPHNLALLVGQTRHSHKLRARERKRRGRDRYADSRMPMPVQAHPGLHACTCSHSFMGCKINKSPFRRNITLLGGAFMFSAWNFDTWFGSLVVMLFIGSIITGFATFLTALLSRILGREPALAQTAPVSGLTKKDSIREAA